MATNGKSKVLTKRQVNKLQTILDQANIKKFLSEKDVQFHSIEYPIRTGRCSEKTYNKLLEKGLI